MLNKVLSLTYQMKGVILMQGIELVESRLFKVVKITDRDGVDKHHYPTQGLVFNEIVRILYRLEIGETTFISREDLGGVITTSTVQDYNLTNFAWLPTRLIIKTLNTIYTLDEVVMNNGKDVYHGSSPSVLFFDNPESELVH